MTFTHFWDLMSAWMISRIPYENDETSKSIGQNLSHKNLPIFLYDEERKRTKCYELWQTAHQRNQILYSQQVRQNVITRNILSFSFLHHNYIGSQSEFYISFVWFLVGMTELIWKAKYNLTKGALIIIMDNEFCWRQRSRFGLAYRISKRKPHTGVQ